MRKTWALLFTAAAVVTASFVSAHQYDKLREVLAVRLETDSALRAALLKNARPVTVNFNYAVLLDSDSDVLLLGEQHGDPAFKREANIILKSLGSQKLGFTHFASEFLLADEQPALNDFFAKKINLDRLEEKLALPGYSSAVHVAARYGMLPLGLDLPQAQQNPAWATSAQGMAERNRQWGKIIGSVAQKDLKSRFIVYAGAWHTQLYTKEYPSLPSVLNGYGLKTKTVEFVNQGEKAWRTLLESKKTADKPVLITVPAAYVKTVNADYIIYLPPSKPLGGAAKDKAEKLMDDKNFNWKHCTEDPDNPLCKLNIKNNR